jgi:dihydroneopterin aldolase
MHDKIFLHGLKASCRIGIFDWERKKRQKVVIDLEFPADVRKAAKTDRIADTADYKTIAKAALRFVSQSDCDLVETLAERLSAFLLKQFSLKELSLRVSKPGAIRGSKNVGVEIFRRKK